MGKKSVKGRPTKYIEDYNRQAYRLCLLGATDKNLADSLDVTEQTINGWKIKHPVFFESIRAGREEADANVAERMYLRAVGYEHDDVHISSYQGAITETKIRKYYPPDTQAASLWLRNRQPAKWRDKQDVAISGGLSIEIVKFGDK